MGREVINIGTNPGDGTGDELHEAGEKINNMTAELYDAASPAARGSFNLTVSSGDFNVTQSNRYERRGGVMHVWFDFQVTATNSAGTGELVLEGLPVAPADNSHAGGGMQVVRGVTLGKDWLIPRARTTSDIRFFGLSMDGSNEQSLQHPNLGSTWFLRGYLNYRVSV